VTQDRTIGNSDLLQDFMLAIQHVMLNMCKCSVHSEYIQASCGQVDASVELEVFLCNQKSKKISCSSFDRTSHVLEVNHNVIFIRINTFTSCFTLCEHIVLFH
jgi:hypothetical protein